METEEPASEEVTMEALHGIAPDGTLLDLPPPVKEIGPTAIGTLNELAGYIDWLGQVTLFV